MHLSLVAFLLTDAAIGKRPFFGLSLLALCLSLIDLFTNQGKKMQRYQHTLLASPRNFRIPAPVSKHQMLSSEKLFLAIESRQTSCPDKLDKPKQRTSLCSPDFRYGEMPTKVPMKVEEIEAAESSIPAALPVAPLAPSRQRTQRRRSSLLFTPGHDTPIRKDRKRRSLTFSSEVETREIPRYTNPDEVFWTEAELNLMRCEANMRKAGVEPEVFDWKSFR